MNMTEFIAPLESSATVGLDNLNYDSFWDHSATQDIEEAEEESQEVVVEEEVVEVTEASTKASRSHTQNYNQKEDVALCDAWCAILMILNCRGSIVAFSINKSVEPNKKQKLL